MLRPKAPIILYAAGPAFDLPEASSFAMKTEIHLKMADIPYRKDNSGFHAAPKGKLPYIRDGKTVIGDSTLIRQHLEWSYGFDFDGGLDLQQRAMAWTTERLLEDHLYWAGLRSRWLDPVNFARGPAQMIGGETEAARAERRAGIQAGVAAELFAHGLGRHSDEDILFLATHSLYSFATLLGDKDYLMGNRPCGADATACGVLSTIITPFFPSDLRENALGFDNLAPYVVRLLQTYYPEHDLPVWARGGKTASCSILA
jgi:glutathione S-transferase